MKTKIILLLTFTLVFFLNSFSQVASGGNYSLEKTVVAGGGSDSSGGNFSLTGTAGQNLAGTNKDGSPYIEKSGFWTPEMLAPTAATVSVGGRIMTADGAGIRNVVITISNSLGQSRTAISSTFGYYRFNDIEVGETYIISVVSKRFTFAQPTRIVSVNDELTDLDFTANDQE